MKPKPSRTLTTTVLSVMTLWSFTSQATDRVPLLKAHFFDVGQADAALFEGPQGCNVLVDAGHWQKSDLVPYLREAGIERIDVAAMTHPHADHIGQLDQVLEAFDVREVWRSGYDYDSQTYKRSVEAVDGDPSRLRVVRSGNSVQCGKLSINVINPVSDPRDVHDGVALNIIYHNTAFILTGDMEAKHEKAMIRRGESLEANVLQLGHHGSYTSSDPAFLNTVNPQFTLYSAGEDNRYGHPHDVVIDRLEAMDIPVHGTDTHGTIRIHSNGLQINLQ